MQKNSHMLTLAEDQLFAINVSEDWVKRLAESLSHKKVILIGESTHGTHEFYKYRALITKELIQKHNFNIVAIEADWPDAYQVNCYVKGLQELKDDLEALSGFKRFPSWMWRNYEVLEFVSWLKLHNDSLGSLERKVGFYGLDLYSLYSSINAVIKYLLATDPDAARRAIARYRCFDHYNKEAQDYGFEVSYGIGKDCKEEAINQLIELEQRVYENLQSKEIDKKEAFFSALQNARTVKSAETYYRAMFESPTISWNLRDQHMFEMLIAIIDYYNESLLIPPKTIVWAHNSHIGNAAATEMTHRGELNIGQLAKEKYHDDAFLFGFTTYTGTVVAARQWGNPAELMQVKQALPGSWEDLLHKFTTKKFFLNFDANKQLRDLFANISPQLQRAIGVIYRPETERQSHYSYSELSLQFDGIIHIDHTSALSPLNAISIEDKEPPETFPTAL
jgi:erythromycin esterase-like protein